MNILIVEDDFASSYLLEIYLKKIFSNIEKNIYTANTSKDAIEICKENHIDLIIMDVRLVGDIDGIETTKLIREFNNDVIIIVQSAYTIEYKKEIFDAGTNEFIKKPISINELYRVINKYFPVDSSTI
jgi:CheY-like chemotaxis protein